jgi:signal transduction histidine kinase
VIRPLRPLVIVAALFALLVVLATVQYRWLGQVSDAERERLRAGMRARATEFSDEFDRELTRIYLAFHVGLDVFDRNPGETLADACARAQNGAPVDGIIRAVYVLETRGPATVLLRFDPVARMLAPTEWPAELDLWRRRAEHLGPFAGMKLSPALMFDAVDSRTPALAVPLPTVQRIEKSGQVMFMPDPDGPVKTIIVWLDADRLTGLVDALVRRHFGAGEVSEYAVTIVRRDAPSDVVYSSGGNPVTPHDADFRTGAFDLRLDELDRFTAAVPPPGPLAQLHNRLAITVVRRADRSGPGRVLMAGGDAQGAWQVLVRPRNGSLEALVARSRKRNLAVSLGIVGLLGVSFAFVIASAQRQQRLARQQMEFVAAVSHELRTPLAVIRSAGENLADGIVGDEAQVKRYGSLIETEGRRLTEMVERVMSFAGITSAARAPGSVPVDVARVVREAVDRVTADLRVPERVALHENISLRDPAGPVAVSGDADALRSAFENVIANAVKYSPAGASVDVDVVADGGRVRIVVADRGIGIDRDELPHVFQPFFRGRRAVDAQIRGTGIGLSVVRHVVDAHKGEVRVDSEPGRGTQVTIDLPVVSAPA